MSDTSTVRTPAFGTTGLLFVAFVVLKLTGVITWSWWWVTAPLWIGTAFAILALLVTLLVVVMADGHSIRSARTYRASHDTGRRK